MRMQSLGKELLHSLPVEVHFAGFKGNTLSLAKAGWDLSMEQSEYYGEKMLRLAMRHEGAKLYAISQETRIDYGRLHAAMDNRIAYAELLTQIPFIIQAVAPSIRFATMGVSTRSVGFAQAFNPIDPFPQERIMEERIEDFKFFKVANPNIRDIIVSPDQVPELLDLVLKAQKPAIDEIRKREQSRKNTRWVHENMGSTKPAHQVQAQIITLAGAS